MIAAFSHFGLFAVGDSVGTPLTYGIPDELWPLATGSLCRVPVVNTQKVGLYLGPTPTPSFNCKPIAGLLPYVKPLRENQLALLQWLADYYLAPVGRTARLLAPGFIWDVKKHETRQKRFKKFERPDGFLSIPPLYEDDNSHAIKQNELNDSQKSVVDEILNQKSRVTLLQGVTGSGKTEVYIELAKHMLEKNMRVLILVPEIALTPQTSRRFFQVFGSLLGVLHSGLTPVDYEREWFRANHGLTKVLLGVRSAVFAPLADIGLIIVDEEHDGGYKCDEFPCYQARDVAVKRAHLENSLCVLGSATPSMESEANVRAGRYQKLELTARAVGSVPVFEIIDARDSLNMKLGRKAPNQSSFIEFKDNLIAPHLLDALMENKQRAQQTMIILNRRGFANFALCASCGQSLKCPHCSVSTTLHKRGKQEVCHYCGFSRVRLPTCDSCGSEKLIAMGAGTQNIESELSRLLPELRVERLDRDVMTSQTRLDDILNRFRAGDIDCLVGTQILAKGHDFPKVTLVVILYIEDGLFLPDFRSGERTFQLLMQGAGRAGRGQWAGRVLLQSLVPTHPVIDFAAKNDVNAFLEREYQLRSMGWHPPLCRQILFEIKGRTEGSALMLGNAIRSELAAFWKEQKLSPEHVRLAGPYPAALEKIKNEYRFQLCISARKELHPGRLVPVLRLAERLKPLGYDRFVRLDVDPYSFL